jgi:hypothetical protein
MVRGLALVSCLMVMVGCGGDNPAATPTPVAPTASRLTVSGGTNVYIGQTLQLTSSLTLSDGTTQTPTCTWAGDNPSVATIDASSGLVSGQGSGEESVWCDASGLRGAKLLRGLPNYGGTWSGDYTVTSCTQTGDVALANFCGSYTPGSTAPYRWDLAQVGDLVSGTFTLGALQFTTITASVPLGGNITFTSRNVSDASTLTVTWQANIPRPNTLVASLAETLTSAGLSGQAVVSGTVTTMTRTASPLIATSR